MTSTLRTSWLLLSSAGIIGIPNWREKLNTVPKKIHLGNWFIKDNTQSSSQIVYKEHTLILTRSLSEPHTEKTIRRQQGKCFIIKIGGQTWNTTVRNWKILQATKTYLNRISVYKVIGIHWLMYCVLFVLIKGRAS